ncbi:MAG: DUF4139 domain-containing protein [Chthonomonas sp.]|nr:DUF4139 domain-containing protein [Chthonomonas sp.]
MIHAVTLAAAIAAGPTAVELTVYNQGFALVKETRSFDLRSGRQLINVEDVAERIEPSSVAIKSLSAPGSFTVLEQNYQYDLISVNAILQKAVGQRITFNRTLPNGEREVVRGTLLSAPTNPTDGSYSGMVIRADDGRILLNPSGEISVDSLPDGLISKPTLVWDLESNRAGSNTVELSYLTQGIGWSCDYVLALEKDGAMGDFKGWVRLDNQSGANFNNAVLKLLAGDVQRAQQMRRGGMAGAPTMDAGASKESFAEEQFADYHLYTLQRPATVKNRESKQVSLLEAFMVPVKKKLILDPMRAYGGWRPQEGEVGTGSMKPQIRIEFKNDQASRMGMPLPQGTVKVYQRDRSGSLQLLGEDAIGHTPKDEMISLVVGRAFDVVGERKRTKFEYFRDGTRIRGANETFEIQLRNRKETADTVTCIERYWGEYKVTKNSQPYQQLDSNTFQFEVALKPNEVKTITFTVESRW